MDCRRAVWCMHMAIGCAAASSFALLGAPLRQHFEGSLERTVSFAAAGIFWGCLLLEQFLLLQVKWHRDRTKIPPAIKKRLERSRSGFLTFGSNQEAAIADILFFAAVLIATAMLLFQVRSLWAVAASLSSLLLTLQFHCMFNGKNFIYVRALSRFKKESGK